MLGRRFSVAEFWTGNRIESRAKFPLLKLACPGPEVKLSQP